MISGGTEAALVGLCLAAFRRMGALSRVGDRARSTTRRDGFVMGEGSAVLVLEREEHARARGAQIRPRQRLRRDQRRLPHHPARGERRGAVEAMTAALRDADLAPQDVGYVNAHGTSTPINDRVETLALRQVLGEDGPPVSSCKGAVGTRSAPPARSRRWPASRPCAAARAAADARARGHRPRVRRRPHRRRAARGAGSQGRPEQLALPSAVGTRPSSSKRPRNSPTPCPRSSTSFLNNLPPARGWSCCSTPARSGRSAARWATVCCRAAGASRAARSSRGPRTARSRRLAGRRGRRDDRQDDPAADALGVPVVGFPHSGGARLQEGVAALSAYAAIFRAQAQATVPMISVVPGPCAGGAGVLAARWATSWS